MLLGALLCAFDVMFPSTASFNRLGGNLLRVWILLGGLWAGPTHARLTEQVLQAEDGQLANGANVATSIPGYNGTGHVTLPATGGSVTWNGIEGGPGGGAHLRIRYQSNSAATSTRFNTVTVNGTAVRAAYPVTSGEWAETTVFVPLAPGAGNSITIQNTEGVAVGPVDQITVGIPAPVRVPTKVFWGGFRGSWDLVGTNATNWSFVRENMDGYILHGAYWNFLNNPPGAPSPDVIGPQLAPLVAGKEVILEHLLAGLYPDPDSAFGRAAAGSPTNAAGFNSGVANIKRLMNYGFPLPLVSTDYIMSGAWQQSVRFRPEWTSKEFFTALTGDWDGYTGTQFNTNAGSADRNTYGWFRQWTEGLAAAFPDIRVSATMSPVYFNWEQDGVNRRELGGAINNYPAWLKLERRGDNITASYSGDGNGWRALGSTNVALGASPLAGVFVSSLDGARLVEGRADSLRMMPFFFGDLGKPGVPGTVQVSGAKFTLTGHGLEFLHPTNNTSDAQFYTWREWSGDGSFTVKLESLTGSNAGRTNAAGELPTAGITIRESAAPNARQVSLHANLANQLQFVARPSPGTVTTNVAPRVAGAGVRDTPTWLRVSRTNNTITAAYSGNGTTWTNFSATANIAFPTNVLVGLVADSQVRSEKATAVFDEVSFLDLPVTPSYAGTSLGTAGDGATSSLGGGTLTNRARGAGLGGTADAGRLHAAAMTGDGTYLARLSHFADVNSPATEIAPGAQLGVTLRASTNANSRHASIVFTPGLGLRQLARVTDGAATTEVATYGAGETSIQPNGTGTLRRPLLHYFTGNDLMSGLHGAFPADFSKNYAGFTTDSPYAGYQRWGGSETNAEAIAHRRKIILYERWLQERGREHHFIANSAGANDFDGFNTATPEGRDAWDLRYKQQSMRSLQLHQLEGGRPDAVYFESWYEGPYSMVPETKDGSFSNLARDGLFYIKGVDQTLDLQVRLPGGATFGGGGLREELPSATQVFAAPASAMGQPLTFTVRLRNTGTVPALPLLHAWQTGADGWNVTYSLRGADVTAAITGPEGTPVTASATRFSELVAPGADVDVEVTATPTSAVRKGRVLLRAFWNPQDPSLTARDAVELEFAPPTELVGNGDFENGTTGWTATGGGIAAESTVVRSGSGAIRSFSRSAAWNGPAQDIPGRLIPGQVYFLTAWVRAASAANVRATIRYEGATGSPVFHNVATVNGVDNSGWFPVQGYYRHTEPNGTPTLLRLYFETTGSPAYLGEFYVDDVSLTLASPVWTDANPGARGWNTTTSWQSGNVPVSFSGNSVAFFPSQTVSTGSITAIQNLGNNFQLNSLTLGGAAPTNGAAATVAIGSNSLAFTGHDGTAPSLRLEAIGTNLSYAVTTPLVLDDHLFVSGDGTANFLVSSAVSGSGALGKTGGAALTLSASNSFSGGVVLGGGTVVVAANSALGTGDVLVAGGSLRAAPGAQVSLPNSFVLSSNLATGGLLNIDGPVQLTGANRTVTVDAGSVALCGVVSDDAARNLTKNGAGTLLLGGANTHRGTTTVGDGVLRITNGSALGVAGTATNGFTFLSGGNALATLELAGGLASPEVIKIAMHNTAGHHQMRNVSGANQLQGALLFEGGGGRWDVASAGGTLTLAGLLSNTVTGNDVWRVLNLHGPGAGVMAGPTGDTRSGTNGSLLNIRVNSGTWTMTGPGKTHLGTNIVTGGTLVLESAVVSPVAVENGATIAGSGSTATNFTINAGATVLRRLADWGAPEPALGAARFIGPGNSNWTIRIDGAGLAGFTETNKTVPVFHGVLSNISPGAISVATVDFPGQGTWSVATNSTSLSLQYTAEVPDAFAAWQSAIAWDGRPSGPLDDPDGDGVPNLAEYAFGGDPLEPGDNGHPVVTIDGDRLKLTFHRIADPALIYEVLATDDLSSPGTVIWSSTGAGNVAGPVTVTDTVTTQERSKRFVRVRISR
jgi:autotransporter-associated beta strand protein